VRDACRRDPHVQYRLAEPKPSEREAVKARVLPLLDSIMMHQLSMPSSLGNLLVGRSKYKPAAQSITPSGLEGALLELQRRLDYGCRDDMYGAAGEILHGHEEIVNAERRALAQGARPVVYASKLDQAAAFYRARLKDGPRLRPEIEGAAGPEGISRKTLRAARDRLRERDELQAPYKRPGSRHYWDELRAA
jgi:hypothetical protein